MFHTALDSSQIASLNNSSACTSHGGWWFDQLSLCGTHATQPAYAVATGTSLTGHPYTNIDNGILAANGGSISFTTPSQPAPGLVTGTFTDAQSQTTSPIAMAITQINGKYAAIIITHSPAATFGGGFNVFAVEGSAAPPP